MAIPQARSVADTDLSYKPGLGKSAYQPGLGKGMAYKRHKCVLPLF